MFMMARPRGLRGRYYSQLVPGTGAVPGREPSQISPVTGLSLADLTDSAHNRQSKALNLADKPPIRYVVSMAAPLGS